MWGQRTARFPFAIENFSFFNNNSLALIPIVRVFLQLKRQWMGDFGMNVSTMYMV